MKTQYIIKDVSGTTHYYADPEFRTPHREDGPAVERPVGFADDGLCLYYLNGQKLTKDEHAAAVAPKPKLTALEAALQLADTEVLTAPVRTALNEGGGWVRPYYRIAATILATEVRRLQALLDAPKPLPVGLRELPEGAVYLGRGGEFDRSVGLFEGWCHCGGWDSWEHTEGLCGLHPSYHYAAPADSAIVAINRK